MAHSKQANAVVTHPRITGRGWGGVRRVATSGPSRDLTSQAREILGGALDPDKFLFTHCTIVASVDTEKVPGVKLGKVSSGSFTVDRRYADYHIKPECIPYVNNNGDSWSRQVLLASYPSFIGGQNYQEHVQIEEQSKGRIIDAVARDLGESVYIDILVATDRKHEQLIQDIKTRKMGTLSMGCTTDFTLCSKCGHFAVDQTDLCEHIKYSKLNTFLDDQGKKRVIAELCGHADYASDGGVHFIEASWVEVPAFQGAVLRNVLTAEETGKTAEDLRSILESPASWSDKAVSKAASLSAASSVFAFGEDEAPAAPPAAPPAPPFKGLEDSVYNLVTNRVKERIEKEVSNKPAPSPEPSVAPNDTIIKESARTLPPSHQRTALIVPDPRVQDRYHRTLEAMVRVASSQTALVEGIASTNEIYGLKVATPVYRAALQAGPLSQFATPQEFLLRCRKACGRDLSQAELRVAIRVGHLLSRWASSHLLPPTT